MMQTRASCSGTAFLGIFLGNSAQYDIILADGVACGVFVDGGVAFSFPVPGPEGAGFGLGGALDVK